MTKFLSMTRFLSVIGERLLAIHIGQCAILDARGQEHQLRILACRSFDPAPIDTCVLGTVPRASQLITFALEGTAQMHTHICYGLWYPAHFHYEHLTSKELNCFCSIFRDLFDFTQWYFHFDVSFLENAPSPLGNPGGVELLLPIKKQPFTTVALWFSYKSLPGVLLIIVALRIIAHATNVMITQCGCFCNGCNYN
jgi:hypothetical protein